MKNVTLVTISQTHCEYGRCNIAQVRIFSWDEVGNRILEITHVYYEEYIYILVCIYIYIYIYIY